MHFRIERKWSKNAYIFVTKAFELELFMAYKKIESMCSGSELYTVQVSQFNKYIHIGDNIFG